MVLSGLIPPSAPAGPSHQSGRVILASLESPALRFGVVFLINTSAPPQTLPKSAPGFTRYSGAQYPKIREYPRLRSWQIGAPCKAAFRQRRLAAKANAGGGPTGRALPQSPGRLLPKALRLPRRRAALVSKQTSSVRKSPTWAIKESLIWGMHAVPPRCFNLIIVRSGAAL